MDKDKEEEIIQVALDVSRKEFKKYENKINPAHRFDHTERVFNLCKEILKFHIGEADRLIVLVSAAFHDIGRRKDKNGQHALWSVDLTLDIFEKDSDLREIEEDKKKKIIKIIKHHSDLDENLPKDVTELIEFKIVVDADRIDSFGPVGIIRAAIDERFEKSSKKQLDHIREKYSPTDYKIRTRGGQDVGNRFKEFLYSFDKLYKEQENIGK